MKLIIPFRSMRAVPALLILLLAAGPACAANEALLELFRILRDKGSLSQDEYELLVNTAKAEQEKTELARSGVREEEDKRVAAVEKKAEAIGWAEKITLKGDVRTRYQFDDEETEDRGRGRLRYRLGVIAQPTSGWEVGAGLASGGSDQRSTNQSFDESFSTKNINLDYAYMQYAFANGLSAVAGKFVRKNYLWAPTDVMWDSDINPEGLSLKYAGTNAWGAFFTHAGVWVLEENSGSSDDPYMGYGQLGQSWSAGAWSGTLAAAVYGFSDVNFVSDFTASEGTNTDSKLSSFNLAAEAGRRLGAGKLKFLGEYINNFETNTAQDTAWALGAAYSWDKWSFKYIYADVEANSVPDFLPDSDRFDGLTGIRGHEFEIQYALMNNVTLALDLYTIEHVATNADQNILQADINVKF